MKSILHKSFRYVPSYGTDLKARFRKENAALNVKAAQEAAALQAQAERDAQNAAEAQQKTITLKARKA
jgi:hypothetical protein